MFNKIFKAPVSEKKLSGARQTIRESLQVANTKLTEILRDLDPAPLSLVSEPPLNKKKVKHD